MSAPGNDPPTQPVQDQPESAAGVSDGHAEIPTRTGRTKNLARKIAEQVSDDPVGTLLDVVTATLWQ